MIIKIKPVDPAETKRLESQATLKVVLVVCQALLQIQQSVDRLTDVESAIAIIAEIFGI
jgi:hypothetical protein